MKRTSILLLFTITFVTANVQQILKPLTGQNAKNRWNKGTVASENGTKEGFVKAPKKVGTGIVKFKATENSPVEEIPSPFVRKVRTKHTGGSYNEAVMQKLIDKKFVKKAERDTFVHIYNQDKGHKQ